MLLTVLGVVNWDVAGIVASCATFVTALVGGLILLRSNKSQHDNNATAVDDRSAEIKKLLADHMETVNNSLTVLGSNQEILHKGQERLHEGHEIMFNMIVELDSKVTKPANRAKKSNLVVSPETTVLARGAV